MYNGQRVCDYVKQNRTNPKYCPGVKLRENIEVFDDASVVASSCDVIVFVYAVRHVHHVLKQIAGHLKPDVLFISFSKVNFCFVVLSC